MNEQPPANVRDEDELVVTDDELLVDAVAEPAVAWRSRGALDRALATSDRYDAAPDGPMPHEHRVDRRAYGNQGPVGLQHPDFQCCTPHEDERTASCKPLRGPQVMGRVRAGREVASNASESRERRNSGRGSRRDDGHIGGSVEGLRIERMRFGNQELIREGDVLLGKYRVERVATESLVITAEAVHLEMGNRVVVHLLSPHQPGFAAARDHFVRTTRTLSRMQSRHVGRILDAGTIDAGAPFMVTQLVGMTSLAELIRDEGPLPISDTVDFVVQVCEALAEAHSHGITHGNVTPANVRVSTGIDGWPAASLVGFGIAAQWTLAGFSGHSSPYREEAWPASCLPYMAPEQIRRPMDLDPRSDIWAIGAVIHETLVGETVYQSDTIASLLASIVADPPAPVSAWRSDVPRQLDSVLNRCLEKEPTARFPSVAELVRALQPFASPETQALIERIARVVARHGSTVPVGKRERSALVHVRSPMPAESSFSNEYRASQSAQARVASGPSNRAVSAKSPMRLGTAAVALAGVSVLAGVGSAWIAAEVVTNRALDKRSEAAVTPVQVFASTPAALPTSSSNLELVGPAQPMLRRPAPVQPLESIRPKQPSQRAAKTSTIVESPQTETKDTKPAERSGRSVVAAGQLFDDIN